MIHHKAARIAVPPLACSLRRNDPAPDRNDTRIYVTHSKEARVPFMKSKSGRVQARLLPGVSLAAVLLLSSSALAGPPFVTDDPEPVDYLHWELYTFSMGTHRMGDTSGVAPPSCDCNYGVLPNVHLHFQPGLALHQAGGGPLESGPGDTEFGIKYRFIEQDKAGWVPSVAIYPLLEVPTGDAARGLGTGRTHAFVPLWVQKDFGDWTTYGGGGYWINPGPGNRDYWFFGWLLQKKINEELTLGGELFHQTANTMDGHASSGFNLGAQYDFTDHDHLLFSAGRGGVLYSVDAAATGYPTTYYIAYQWTS
jgi:hypothetical protein